MSEMRFRERFQGQQFGNGYELVDGVAMRAENGPLFQIPPDVVKRHVTHGHFVELRIDSPRFSVHPDAPAACVCPSCQGEARKPILRHEHPASLLPLPDQAIPSRGWGEDFWVQVDRREAPYFLGVVDNPLAESRLHQVRLGDAIVFHENHILAVHGVSRRELVERMDENDLQELARWLGSQRNG